MKIIKFKEQGFCFGVSRSIEIVKKAISSEKTKRPIYLLGSLVHNKHVNDYFTKLGIILLNDETRLKMLDKVDSGTVIITAHGVSHKVIEKAKSKGLDIIDATCPYVTKTVDKILEKVQDGYHLAYIGKINHPEVETILDEVDGATIIEENKDIPVIKDEKVILAHQTTLSDYDVKTTLDKVLSKYPHVKILKQICMFPEKRQQEISNYSFPKANNLAIVVGDTISNNATKLKELLLRKENVDVMMINDDASLDRIDIKKYDNIYLTSATSTPIDVVDKIYKKLGGK